MPTSPTPLAISLDAAEAMTGISRRTLWRRVADGTIASGEKDARGRATLLLADLLELMQGHLGQDFSADARQKLVQQADAGDALAQAEMGAWLYVLPPSKKATQSAALYWLQLAAEQNNADAMHWLGIVWAQKEENASVNADTKAGADDEHDAVLAQSRAIMWLARAAAHGHVIAQEQLAALVAAVVPTAASQ